MNTKIYYNPRCSKCRQTLALLRDKGIEPTIATYLESPPGTNELIDVIGKLGVDPRDVVRFKEPAAKELGLSRKDEKSTKTWATVLAENPTLLERPIVIRGDKAVIGRPPENVLSIL